MRQGENEENRVVAAYLPEAGNADKFRIGIWTDRSVLPFRAILCQESKPGEPVTNQRREYQRQTLAAGK